MQTANFLDQEPKAPPEQEQSKKEKEDRQPNHLFIGKRVAGSPVHRPSHFASPLADYPSLCLLPD